MGADCVQVWVLWVQIECRYGYRLSTRVGTDWEPVWVQIGCRCGFRLGVGAGVAEAECRCDRGRVQV